MHKQTAIQTDGSYGGSLHVASNHHPIMDTEPSMRVRLQRKTISFPLNDSPRYLSTIVIVRLKIQHHAHHDSLDVFWL